MDPIFLEAGASYMAIIRAVNKHYIKQINWSKPNIILIGYGLQLKKGHSQWNYNNTIRVKKEMPEKTRFLTHSKESKKIGTLYW